VGARDLSADPISVVVVFDRFPASVRGAVVIRGADGDPHQVTMSSADAVEISAPRRPAAPVTLDHATVDLAPREEMFVPFELPFGELGPGWYGVVAEVGVDGRRTMRSEAPGKLFAVPWPSGEVRRGTVPVGRRIPGRSGITVDRVECKADRTIVRWGGAGLDPEGQLGVLADGRVLPLIEATDREGVRTTVVYPLLKRHRTLTLRVASGELELPLP
jgi:hypothetical protein